MIKKGQTKGDYKGVPYEVARIEGHKDRWYWIVDGVSSLPRYASGKKYALFNAHSEIDALLKAPQKVLATWEDIRKEMSIAGEPDRAVLFGQQVLELAKASIDMKNLPSIDNAIFSLENVIRELKLTLEIEYKRQHP